MFPILFTIPGLGIPVYSFGAMFALAFFLGSIVLERLGKRYGDDPENDPSRYSSLALWILGGIILGARLLYVLVHPDEFLQDAAGQPRSGIAVVGQVLAVWKGGLVFYGGLIGGFALGWLGLRRTRLPLWRSADLGLVAGMLGLGIGRIGCLLVGDDHGRICDASLPFPIALHVPDPLPEKSLFDPLLAGQWVYATQIWMMANGFLLAGLGFLMLPRRKFDGQVAFTLLALYAVTRGTIEFFRGDDAARGFTEVDLHGSTVRLYTSVKIGLVLLPVSLGMLWVLRRRAPRPAP